MRRSTLATLAALSSLVIASTAVYAQDRAPRLIEAPTVTLPADGSLAPGSSVRLELTLDATGAVTNAVVVDSLRPDLDAQVLTAARSMRFEPATRDGHPIATRVRFRFRLQTSATPTAPPTAQTAAQSPDSPIPPNPYREGLPQAPTVVVRSTPSAQSSPPTPPTPTVDPELGGEATIRVRREPGAATVMTLRGAELTTVPGTLGEPTRVVATMPGVSRSPFGLGLFVVRGASFENTGFFIDGFPVPLLYHFGFGPAVISSRLVGQLDFYPGGYPLSYGRFSAGVISLQTRPPPTDKPFLELQLDVLRASVMGVVPFDHGRGSIAVAARQSYYQLLVPLFVDGIDISYGDYQVRADYRFNSRSRASLFVFGSHDVFDRSAAAGVGQTASQQNTSLGYTFHRVIGRWDYRLPNRIELSVSGMVGVDDASSINRIPGQADQSFETTGFILGERASLKIPTGRWLTTTLGIDILTISFDADLQVPLGGTIGGVPPPAFDPTVVSFKPRLSQLSFAAYIEECLRVGGVELTTGVRLDRLIYAAVDTTVADPRMVFRYRFGERVTAQVATGFFHQPPPFFQLVPEVRNPRLRPQRSWQSSAGVELKLPWHFEARLTGFFTRMYNLQRPTNETVNTPQGPERLNVADDGQGRSYGLEVLLRRQLSRGVYGWVSYTLSRSERFVDGGVVVPFPFDQTHVLNLAVSWNINSHWQVGARFQLATGNPRQRVTGSYYDADRDNYRATFAPRADDGSDMERLPYYHQLDVRVDYRFRAGPVRMSAYLDVINVYYAHNTETWLYQYDFARRTSLPGLPILPALGLTGEL